MKIVKHKKGQFIIFATLIVAVMIISIGTIMYGTVTYFKHERWQEYLMIIDNIELGSQRVVEISLANYTSTLNNGILTNNLNQWQMNLTKAYPGFGVALTYSDATIDNGTRPVTSQINDTMYFSSANATFNISITSVGLTGYKFVASAFLGVILSATLNDDLEIFVAVEKEDSTPVTNLNKNSFSINNESLANYPNSTLTHFYEMDNDGILRIVYRIEIPNDPGLSNVLVAIVDVRGIKVIVNSTVT